MNVRCFMTAILVAALLTLFPQHVRAQAPPAPTVPPTLWSFLGIPQAYYKLNGAFVNRRGNLPGMEAKPPLKGIAHPDNLESEFEAIKTAAKVKQAEDLAPQKIKGIKYLAKIGCGCYDKEGEVTKAFLAAMEDCTEDVRLATVKAISRGARGEMCEKCGQRSCCSEEISMKLAELAYERDEFGCYVEPSEDVREAAVRALGICCPNQIPIEVLEEEDEGYQSEPGGTPTEAGDPPPELPRKLNPDATDASAAMNRRLSDGIASSSRRTWTGQQTGMGLGAFVQTGAQQTGAPTRQVASRGRTQASDARQVRPRSNQAPVVARLDLSKVRGVIARVDQVNGFANIQVADEVTVPVGTRLNVYHRYFTGTRLVAEIRVVRSGRGAVNARSLDGGPLHKIARGDQVRVVQ